jgi:hypothetical protein
MRIGEGRAVAACQRASEPIQAGCGEAAISVVMVGRASVL